MNETPPIVYVVDDEPAVSISLKRLLRSVGLEARTYASAQEFLRSERPDAPGCLVLDVRLPGLSGLELQQELTAAKVDLPVIFITAYPEKLLTGERPEPTYLIAKPFLPETVQATVGQALFFHPVARQAA